MIIITTIDLFCGCGGMSKGFQKAGFEVIAGFDHWDTAVSCYNNNFSHSAENIDLSNTASSIDIISKYKPEIIIGGPPCQDFSGAGNLIEGDRAELTVAFAKIVQGIAPHYFVMENVERAYNSNAYQKAKIIFKESGYGLTEKVLDASFCNVPQKRKRFFCIGCKNGQDGFLDSFLSENLSVFPLSVREYFQKKNYPLTISYYYRHPRSYTRRGIFSVDEPSPTIRGVNRSKPENYKKHSGDPINPENVRSLSWQERAIIQTFPKDFIWNESLASIEQMIGNAVPVNLAYYVANCLMHYINGDTDVNHLHFIDWLKKVKQLSPNVSGDILSRICRAKRIVNFGSMECSDYIDTLNKEPRFLSIGPSVQSQIRRSVRLYYEYNEYCDLQGEK